MDNRHLSDSYSDIAGLHQDIFLRCDEIQTLERLKRELLALWPEELSSGAVKTYVAEMKDAGVHQY